MVFVKGSLHLQTTNREGSECRKGGQIGKESSVNTGDLCEVQPFLKERMAYFRNREKINNCF